MIMSLIRSDLIFQAVSARLGRAACFATLVLSLVVYAHAQQPDAASQPETPPAQSSDAQQPAAPAPSPTAETPQTGPVQVPASTTPPETTVPVAPAVPATSTPDETSPETDRKGGMSEDELKQLVVGKQLYLRGGYLDNTLSFDEHGHLIGHSPQGSYTLNIIQIEKAHLTKQKVELQGARYGLHFTAQLAYEDASKAVDQVRITPKKKMVKITIDREIVVKLKKVKVPKPPKGKKDTAAVPAAAVTPSITPVVTQPITPVVTTDVTPAVTPAATTQAQQASQQVAATQTQTQSVPPQVAPIVTPDATQAVTPAATTQAKPAPPQRAHSAPLPVIGTPEERRAAHSKGLTITTSPAHAKRLLNEALDNVFAPGLDERMMAAMPDFWKLYYKAVADKVDYRPKDPAILRQNTVDKKAVLLTKFEPDSNEFAQANGVAGMALYHTVVGPDGKAQEIVVGRPIGFGLDESAVAAIRKASFQPAVLDGKPVPVLLDLVVQFRIFSKRTSVVLPREPADKPAEPAYPGPYSVPSP